jgi:hypothetical protein
VEGDTRSDELALSALLLVVSRNLRQYPSHSDTKKLQLDQKARADFARVINPDVPSHFKPTEVTKFDARPFRKETSLDRIQRINDSFHSINTSFIWSNIPFI